jgi:hypothetical protein
MKNLILSLFLFCATFEAFAAFDDWFINKTLRIDYYHTGNAQQEMYSIDQVKSEPFWGGSQVTLIDTLNYGEYYFKAFDLQSNKLLFSHGFSTLFDEWQYTEEAKKTTRTFTETVIMPFPKNDIRIELFSRNFMGIYEKKFEYTIEVKSYFISNERQMVYPVYDALLSGDPAKKIDIVILPEGYTAAEMDRFKADCDKFTAELFTFEPYSRNRDKFNIRAVLSPSVESGTDIPGEKIWKNTLMNSSFYTFDSERYLMTYDNKSVRNLAANAPYDQIYILVNSEKYGGGAIYNYYSTSVNSNASSAKIFVHEFGHGFAALADEYDDGSTSFNDIYPLNIEPWEPNITTLAKFETKWKGMLPTGTPVPTPLENSSTMQLGVYEGAGYVAKGVYRPVPDCLMRSFKGDKFCPVCSAAIQKMLDYYSK